MDVVLDRKILVFLGVGMGLSLFLLAHPEPVINGGTCGPYKWPYNPVSWIFKPCLLELVHPSYKLLFLAHLVVSSL